MRPIVSVAIPTFQRLPLLKRAVKSVLQQNFSDMEIIVCDDVSNEETWQAILDLRTLDDRIKVYQNEARLGFGGNLNRCISLAQGTYVWLLHDDDELLSGAIEAQASFLQEHPCVGMVHPNGYDIMPDGSKILRRTQDVPILRAGSKALYKIMTNNNIIPSAPLVRRECYENLGGFTDTCSTDWEMWARIARYHDLGHVDQPLVNYYVHGLSPRSPVSRYERDWNYLGQMILSYFPPGERTKLLPELRKEIGNGLFSLGRQAWRQAEWGRGTAFIWRAARYQPASVWCSFFLQSLIKLIPQRHAWKRMQAMSHQCHV